MAKATGKPRGRPPMPAGESKDEVLTIRVQPGEKELLENAAAKCRLPVSEFIRQRVFAPAPPNVWTCDGVRLETPRGMTREVWRILSGVVAILEPTQEDL